MHSRAPLFLACCGSVLVATGAWDLQAQGIVSTPLGPHNVIVAPIATAPQSPGTGPLTGSLDLAGSVVPLGNGTVVQFSDPSIPAAVSAGGPPSGQSTTPGRATIVFAANDRLAGNSSRAQSCNSPLLTLMCQLRLIVLGADGQTTATYVMRGVNILSTSSASPMVITFAYKQIQYTLQSTPQSGTTRPAQ